MTKTLQSNKQSEVDAESVPSSLRIVCDDSSSINLQAAEAAEEGKPALRKFSMVAYTGGAMRLGGWPYPVVVDLAACELLASLAPFSRTTIAPVSLVTPTTSWSAILGLKSLA